VSEARVPESDEQKEPKKGFKVVDRRRFDEEGEVRTGPDVQKDVPVRKDPPAAAPASAPQQAAPAGPPPGPPPSTSGAQAGSPAGAPAAAAKEEVTPGGLSFSIFLQSLAQQALMQMGLIPWPHGQRELHLEQARDTIDIVTLLKIKTKGNLSAEEQQLMDTVVYELRMSYVEVQSAIARSKGAKMPPPPGAPR
jgi:hypothetical protein